MAEKSAPVVRLYDDNILNAINDLMSDHKNGKLRGLFLAWKADDGNSNGSVLREVWYDKDMSILTILGLIEYLKISVKDRFREGYRNYNDEEA